MRLALAFFLLATPAGAWEFTAAPVCTLSHDAPGAAVRITHDPRRPEPYAIALTRPEAPWPEAASFALAFEGPRGFTITTGRHGLSDGGRTLTVTDRGFGNVLDGLQFNETATARAGDLGLGLSLAGAAEPVEAFRACAAALAA